MIVPQIHDPYGARVTAALMPKALRHGDACTRDFLTSGYYLWTSLDCGYVVFEFSYVGSWRFLPYGNYGFYPR